MQAPERNPVVETIWRAEAGKITARLVRMVRDVDLAEEIAQEALVSAIERWPESGVPDNPGAWLMATAKNRAIDELRRARVVRAKHEAIAHETEAFTTPSFDEAADDEVGDDLLKLVFVACHPVLPREGQVALTLRLLGGLSTAEIARAFLVSEPTVAQRIVRAKKTLADKRIPFEVPRAEELGPRLAAVIEVVYLVFNEGYSATAGEDWMRPALCDDALRLGRVLAALVPGEADVHALVALMEIQASRTAARVDASGEPVLLLEQDRGRWDREHIARGLAALIRAEELAGSAPTPYLIQAEIAACHARAGTAEATDWARIAGLYELLGTLAPSPIVDLNRAVAVGRASGPEAGLALVDAIAGDPLLAGYHFLPTVRADLLARLGRMDEARAELMRAAELTQNERERAMLLARARSFAQ
ncbi:MAG TPA: RNA polymerase sigma factor [Labilithrix sp.]|nr:RNA polymerase sigma factor [Labilithrix sp.]